LRALFERSLWEFVVAAIVIAAELTLGVVQGIGLGVVLALLMLTYRATHPHVAVLGRLPGTEAYRDVKRHPEAITFPGLLIWRPAGDLFFASVGHAIAGMRACLDASNPPARFVLFDASSVDLVDTSGCDDLLTYVKELHAQGITVAFARVRDPVRERMKLAGIEAAIGAQNFHERVTDGVRAWQQGRLATAPSVGSDRD
jgi:MFS superfamily sulfate permease-like transporter